MVLHGFLASSWIRAFFFIKLGGFSEWALPGVTECLATAYSQQKVLPITPSKTITFL